MSEKSATRRKRASAVELAKSGAATRPNQGRGSHSPSECKNACGTATFHDYCLPCEFKLGITRIKGGRFR